MSTAFDNTRTEMQAMEKSLANVTNLCSGIRSKRKELLADLTSVMKVFQEIDNINDECFVASVESLLDEEIKAEQTNAKNAAAKVSIPKPIVMKPKHKTNLFDGPESEADY